MKRAFTLFELQITLLLTVILMALLFLFTLYFQRNYLHYAGTFRYQRESSVFLDWVGKQARNSTSITTSDNLVRFKLLDGSETLLELDEKGVLYDQLPFFSENITVDIEVDSKSNNFVLAIDLTRKEETRHLEIRYPKPRHLGLMEAAHAL